MITHDAESIEFKFKLLSGFFEGIQEHFSAFVADKFEFPVITASSNMAAVIGF